MGAIAFFILLVAILTVCLHHLPRAFCQAVKYSHTDKFLLSRFFSFALGKTFFVISLMCALPAPSGKCWLGHAAVQSPSTFSRLNTLLAGLDYDLTLGLDLKAKKWDNERSWVGADCLKERHLYQEEAALLCWNGEVVSLINCSLFVGEELCAFCLMWFSHSLTQELRECTDA